MKTREKNCLITYRLSPSISPGSLTTLKNLELENDFDDFTISDVIAELPSKPGTTQDWDEPL